MDCNSTYNHRCDRSRGTIPCMECGSAGVACRSIAYASLCCSHHSFKQPPQWLLQIPGFGWPDQIPILLGSCQDLLRLAFLTLCLNIISKFSFSNFVTCHCKFWCKDVHFGILCFPKPLYLHALLQKLTRVMIGLVAHVQVDDHEPLMHGHPISRGVLSLA